MLELAGDTETPEDERKNEHVVEGQGPLDDVTRQEFDGCLLGPGGPKSESMY